MKNFSEERFPTDIAYGAVGGPEFSTDIVTTTSCKESRNANWVNARIRYHITYGVRNNTSLEQLISFFRSMKGRALAFRFKDWTDYQAQNQLIGYGNGESRSFQLVKTYTCGVECNTRKIIKPVPGSVTAYKNGRACATEVDHTTGIITFDVPPKTGERITAKFEFDIPARFDCDHLPVSIETYNKITCNDIPIVEVKI
jgi:uncharacterized protein (TIGR02217 family)